MKFEVNNEVKQNLSEVLARLRGNEELDLIYTLNIEP